jgi:ribosomal protein L40E
MKIQKKICDKCGASNPTWAHRDSLRCQYLAAQLRQVGKVKVSINCRPLLDRLGIAYFVDIGNYHPGSKGVRGTVTYAAYVAPAVAQALKISGTRRQRDAAVQLAAGRTVPDAPSRVVRYLHPKLPKSEYQPGLRIDRQAARNAGCCVDGIARFKRSFGLSSITQRQAVIGACLGAVYNPLTKKYITIGEIAAGLAWVAGLDANNLAK